MEMSVQKILVVDDSWTELTMIATPLRNSGFEVVTAVDGNEAVEKVLKERPNCIVLDVVLPKQFFHTRRIAHNDASNRRVGRLGNAHRDNVTLMRVQQLHDIEHGANFVRQKNGKLFDQWPVAF